MHDGMTIITGQNSAENPENCNFRRFVNFLCSTHYLVRVISLSGVTITLADLGERAGRTPPYGTPILSFSHTFSLKSTHVGGPRPPDGCTIPLREILDPPLNHPNTFSREHDKRKLKGYGSAAFLKSSRRPNPLLKVCNFLAQNV